MTQYIDKSALVAEVERRIKEIDEIGTYLSPKGTLTNLLCFLDTLEVKEVEEIPVSNDLEEAARKVGQKYFPDEDNIWARPNYEAVAAANAFKEGAKWMEQQLKGK